jgi:hypothetical protein
VIRQPTQVDRAHAAVVASEGMTTAEVAAAAGIAVDAVRHSLKLARRRGLVRSVRGPGARPGAVAREARWYAVEPAQAHKPGLGGRLSDLLVWHGLIGVGALIRETGVYAGHGEAMRRLDTPDAKQQILTRAVAAKAARRIAARLRTRADALDAWAVEAVS